MARIQSSRAKIYETKATVADEPSEHVESEGERLIKEIVQKQLDTRLNLQEQLKQTKEFTSSVEFVPLTQYTVGKSSLKEFEDSAKRASYIEDLKSFGLSNEEVELLLEYEKGEDTSVDKFSKMEKSVLASRLLLIHTKIEQGKKDWADALKASSSSKVGRHEHELGLSVKPESEHTKLLQFALSCRPRTVDTRPAGHPIHRLKDIEQELFSHLALKRKKLKKGHSCKKSNPLLPSNVPLSLSPSKLKTKLYEPGSIVSSSLWDMRERVKSPLRDKIPTRVYTCKPEILYTIKNKKIVPLEKSIQKNVTEKNSLDGQEFVVSGIKISNMQTTSLTNMESNRMSLDQIKLLPRFKDYTLGSPSQVLYLKNLSSSVKEEDLVSLFEHFGSSSHQRITYRLMTGQMRGQAFITFPSIEMATAALDAVNGVVLHKKPVIIQYGRISTT